MGAVQSGNSDSMSKELKTKCDVEQFGPGISFEFSVVSESDLPPIPQYAQRFYQVQGNNDNSGLALSQQQLPPIRFKTHDIYYGQWYKNQMNGLGQMFFANGAYYHGRWENSKPDVSKDCGKGVLIYPDGEVYEGHFKEGKADGNGQYTYSNGWTYIGEWKDDKMNGKGQIQHINGSIIYDGQFKDGLKHGKGVLTIEGKFQYDGQFEGDLMQGSGVLTLMKEKQNNSKKGNGDLSQQKKNQGDQMQGEILTQKKDKQINSKKGNGNLFLQKEEQGDLVQGKGVPTLMKGKEIDSMKGNGDVSLQKEKQGDQMQGEEVIILTKEKLGDQAQAKGVPTLTKEKQTDSKKGNGKITLTNQNQGGQMEGNEVIAQPEKNRRYSGQFANNKMNGIGTFEWEKGQKYVGNYLNNQKNGKGCYQYSDEIETQCDDFINGQLNKYVIFKNLKNKQIIQISYFDNGVVNNNYQQEKQKNEHIQLSFAGDLENIFQ